MKKEKQKAFGSSVAFGDINFPKHLTPKIIHSALFIHNADCKEETVKRVQHCVKEIGEQDMSYAMSLLVLPTLMNNIQHTEEYKEWQQSRIKTLN